MISARAIAVMIGAACAGAAATSACGNLGEPAAYGSDAEPAASEDVSPFLSDAGAHDTEASAVRVRLRGTVRERGTDVAVPFALVAIEVGGFDQTNPADIGLDGGVVPSLKIDPFYEFGTRTDEAGAFALDVPSERVGVHAYESGFLCGEPDAGTVVPGDAGSIVLLDPLPREDGGARPPKPTISGFTATPSIVAPGELVTISARVEAADPGTDPLSDQVLAVEPVTSWAGALAPPEAGTQDSGYPNGIYNRLVPAPTTPGEYTYYLAAATRSCVVSEIAAQKVRVTPSGEGGED